MFQHPAVTLVKQYQVTDIIFPTAWIQELPFLTGKIPSLFYFLHPLKFFTQKYHIIRALIVGHQSCPTMKILQRSIPHK